MLPKDQLTLGSFIFSELDCLDMLLKTIWAIHFWERNLAIVRHHAPNDTFTEELLNICWYCGPDVTLKMLLCLSITLLLLMNTVLFLSFLQLRFLKGVSVYYPKFSDPEMFQISEVFGLWNICIDFTGWASLIPKWEIWNALKSETFRGVALMHTKFPISEPGVELGVWLGGRVLA